jgi:outer membrane lipoprotein-sorting protein
MYLLISIFLSLTIQPNPQQAQARKLLDKVKSLYENASSLEIPFTYEQSKADIAGLSKKGQLYSKGQMFKLILDDFELYNDGKTQYTFFKKNKEVQITDSDSKDNKYHPKYIASIHNSGDYTYKLGKKTREAGHLLTLIEFKPKMNTNPIASLNMYVDEKTNQIQKVQWIETDGNKTSIRFGKCVFDKSMPDSNFTLNINELKGIHIEDLRD